MIWLSLTNTVSDNKIQISILRRGALSRYNWYNLYYVYYLYHLYYLILLKIWKPLTTINYASASKKYSYNIAIIDDDNRQERKEDD